MVDEARAELEITADYADILNDTDALIRKIGRLNNTLDSGNAATKRFERGMVAAAKSSGVANDVIRQRQRALDAERKSLDSTTGALRRYSAGAKDANGKNIGGRFMSKELSAAIDAGVLKAQQDKVDSINRRVENANRTWGAWRTEIARTGNEITATNSAFNDFNGRMLSTSDYVNKNREVLSKQGMALDDNAYKAKRAADAYEAQAKRIAGVDAANRARENARPKVVAPVSSTVGTTPETSAFSRPNTGVLSTVALMQQGKQVASDYQKTLDANAKAEANNQRTIAREVAAAARETATAQRTAAAEQRAAAKETANNAREAERLKNAWKDGHGSIRETNSIMRETATTAALVGAGLILLAAQPARVAIQFEKEFAGVKRTLEGVNDAGLDNLYDSLVDITRQLPLAFSDVTEIATLGGQLGIAGSDLDEFTTTVARFSAVTGISVEKSAEGIGRLGQLMGERAEDYEKISSAIFKVGVSSVATEKDIISISTQISGIARFAGLATPEVVGLSGALASVGTRPELARGLVTRLFTNIVNAVGPAEKNLEGFAKATRYSGEEFKKAWAEDKGGTLVRLLQGIKAEGDGAVNVLNDIGLYSVRDVPAMLRLANSTELVTNLLRLSDGAYKDGGATIDAYGNIMGTTSAKLQILKNNFDALLAAGGTGSLGPISAVADGLSGLLQFIERIISNPVTGTIVTIGLAIAGLLGVVGLAVAAFAAYRVAIGGASIALSFLQAQGVTAAVSMKGLTAQMVAGGLASNNLARGAKLAGLAMKGLGILSLAALAPEGFKMVNEGLDSILGRSNDLDAVIKRLGETKTLSLFDGAETSFQELARSTSDMDINIRRFMSNANVGFTAFDQDIKKVDDGIAELANSGATEKATAQYDALKNKWIEAGGSAKQFAVAFPEATKAIKDAPPVLTQAEEGFEKLGDGAQELAQALGGLSAEELTSFMETLTGSLDSFVDVGTIFDQVTEEAKAFAEGQAEASASATDTWEDFDSGFNLGNYLQKMEEAVKAQNDFESNLLKLSTRGFTGPMLQELAELGPKGAPLVAALTTATEDELDRYVAAFRERGAEGASLLAQELATVGPLLGEIAAVLGQDTANKIAEGINDGTGIQQAINDMGLIIEDKELALKLGLNPDPAGQALELFVANATSSDIYAKLNADPSQADAIYAAYKATVDDGVLSPIDANAASAQLTFDYWKAGAEGGAVAPLSSDPSQAAAQLAIWKASTLIPNIAPVDADTGKADGKVKSLKDKASSPVSLPVIANTGPAEFAITQLINRQAGRAVNIAVNFLAGKAPAIPAPPGANTGGLIPSYFARGDLVGSVGFKSKGKDTVPAMLEPGEFVLRKRAVDNLGLDYLRELNSQGSAVRPAPSARSGGGVGGDTGSLVVELSPRDRALLANAGNVSLRVGDETISGAAGRGSLVSNRKRTH